MRCLCLHARFILNRLITKEKFSYSFCIKLLCLLLCFLRYGINSYSNEIQYVIGIFSFSLNRPFDRLRVSSSYLSSKKKQNSHASLFSFHYFSSFWKNFQNLLSFHIFGTVNIFRFRIKNSLYFFFSFKLYSLFYCFNVKLHFFYLNIILIYWLEFFSLNKYQINYIN